MKYIILFLLIIKVSAYSQSIDIANALKEIEKGNIVKAESMLIKLKQNSPDNPSTLFLDAILTKNGEDALNKYFFLYNKFPDYEHSDEILYRIYLYYYSLGLYKTAENYLTELKKKFPASNLVKTKIQEKFEENSKGEIIDTIKYTIQVGAFLILDNAKKLSSMLSGKGYFTEITNKEIGGSLLNIVNCGKFLSEEEANEVLKELEQKFNIRGRIVKIEN